MPEEPEHKSSGAWEAFNESKPLVVPAIWKAYRHLIERVQRVEDGGDLKGVVSLLLMGAVNDVDSILTLCCCNKIIGAHQLLRAVYEKVLVAKYLKKNPTEVENFLDFDAIHWTKVLDRIKGTLGRQMNPESAANLKARNDDARKKFRQEKCKTCGRTPPHSWTSKDTETLAKDVGLADRYVFCFLEPTLLLHCTWFGLRPLYSRDPSIRLPAILEAVHVLLIIGLMLHQELYDEGEQCGAETGEVYAAWRTAWQGLLALE